MPVHLECGENSKLIFHFDIIIECNFYESEFLSHNYEKNEQRYRNSYQNRLRTVIYEPYN